MINIAKINEKDFWVCFMLDAIVAAKCIKITSNK